MDIIDISMKIEEGMPFYPGNPEPVIEKYKQVPEDSTTESKITLGSHTGTHVDAPEHVLKDGKPVNEMALDNFHGKCQVLDLGNAGKTIDREALEEKKIREDIVLLKTENSKKKSSDFREDFAYLTLSGVNYLLDQGVETVGIDYLSLVEYEGGEKAEKAHRKANKEMTVIEGLKLSEAPTGKFQFAGFPLKVEADGAPMRAVLIKD